MRSSWPGCCCVEKGSALWCLGLKQKSSAAKICQSSWDTYTERNAAEDTGQSFHSAWQWQGLGSRTISTPQERYGSAGKSPKRCKKNDWMCRKLAFEERLREGEMCGLKRGWRDQGERKNVARYTKGWCKEEWHNVSLYLLQEGPWWASAHLQLIHLQLQKNFPLQWIIQQRYIPTGCCGIVTTRRC